MTTRDYFAELYVAGLMGDVGWAIYFPKRDVGFDFVATREIDGDVLIRPVQVKGRYPSSTKSNKLAYGYVGKLTQLHPQMLLVIPYFSTDITGAAPALVAYMPRTEIRPQASKGYACQPAAFKNGAAVMRREFAKYFGADGLAAVGKKDWGTR